ncbi:MAG: YggS family pyridoxal phosphate-dependent enzyme [Flavobacteriaceae bacterium]
MMAENAQNHEGAAHKGLADVRRRIERAADDAGRDPSDIHLVAVTKTFGPEAIEPVIMAGQRAFGENRVQEAEAKWPALKQRHSGLELHLIGPLQSNKAANAVALFDVIHTIDRDKIAGVLAAEMKKQGRSPALFVQVNTGLEPQKAGVAPQDLAAFLARCRDEHGLSVTGLMCIPPVDQPPSPHFALLAKLARENGLSNLSMGMSGDFEEAIQLGATHVRVGSAIFGTR